MTEIAATAPYADASALLAEPGRLRRRADEEGHLFFRGLLPAQDVLRVRRRVLEVAARHGLLRKGSSPGAGVAAPGLPLIEQQTDPRWRAYYCDVVRLREFHALALHPRIMSALETLFGEKVLAHSRNICRTIFPHSDKFTTPPHQDHVHIGGTEETWTVWIPLGDCPLDLGGLAVLPGTHRSGLLETHAAYGAGGAAVEVPEDGLWVWGEMKCGDAIMLHSLTIHQGRDNVSGDRLRISADFRYQPMSRPVRADSMRPHMGWIDWDELYRNWPEDDPLRYYWRDLPLHYAE